MNEPEIKSEGATSSWIIAGAAVAASAVWLGWLWLNPPPDLPKARVYVEGKAWERAIPMLEAIVAGDPNDSEAARLLATCLVSIQRYDDAANLLRRTQGDQAAQADALVGSGIVHLLADKRREAERDWRKALEFDAQIPGVAEAHHKARDKLCALYTLERRRAEFLAESEAMFERALPKERFMPLQLRMRSLVNATEPNAAIKKLRKATAADPDDFHSRAAIGICLADLEKFDEALAEIAPCRTHDPKELFFWEAWCLALEKRGDLKGVAEALKTLPEGAERSVVAARMQSLAAEQRGDLAGAVVHMRQALLLDPDPGHHQRLGQLLLRQRKPDEAKVELELAKSQNPVLGEIQDYMQRFSAGIPEHVRQFADWAHEAGTLMDRLGRFDDGRRWRIAALAADPSYRPSLAALERDAARRYGRE
jgi:tetratricopeptide (TPR) repeat protein